MSKFGEQLRKLRKEKNILSKDLAKILNVEASTITNWEKGNRSPKEDMLIKLANYFNCSVDYLIGRTSDKNSIVYTKEINNIPIVLELDKDYPYHLTPDEIMNMLNQLDMIGFDIKRLIYFSKQSAK